MKNGKPLNPQVGALCVWHNPQVGVVSNFYVPVPSLDVAKNVMSVLADYDLWQYENKVKGDYASATGLMVFEGKPDAKAAAEGFDGWAEWSNEYGYTLDEIMRDPSLDEDVEAPLDPAVSKVIAEWKISAGSGVSAEWIPIYENLEERTVSKIGYGRVPKLLIELTDVLHSLRHITGYDSVEAIMERGLTWFEIAAAVHARKTALPTSYEKFAYKLYVAQLGASHNLCDVIRGHFMFYATEAETSHVYDALSTAVEFEKTDGPIQSRYDLMSVAMSWINSMPQEEAGKLSDIHDLTNAVNIVSYFTFITGIKASK